VPGLPNGTTSLFQGCAALVDAHTVAVRRGKGAEQTLSGDVILVATGSHPNRPRELQLSHPLVHDSDTIMSLQEIPRSLAVIGGGVIGCEYACVFAALGIEVTLIEGREVLLSFLDGELSAILRQRMEALGVRLRVPDGVKSIDPRADEVALTLNSGEEFAARAVLVAAGRNGNTQGLGLEAAGVKVGPRGHVEVNENYQTAVPHIYAAGDVIGFPALASTSMEQARIAMVHAFDLKYKLQLAPILPFAIYTIPEISMAGETEESLRKQGTDYVAGRAYYAANSRGQIIGDGGGLLKLLFSRDEMRLLGVHLVGEQASGWCASA
jgi:NAD(P) transhydrogenase